MNGREKILLDRVLFAVLGLVLTVSLIILYSILGDDASFQAGIGSAGVIKASHPEENVQAVEQPTDAYELAGLTFAGSCTPASMLGSDSYGTFNQEYHANGAEYFLSGLADIFSHDELTFAGCSAVFSDRELQTAEKTVREWYLAPAEMASVFSKGGVDVLSLECARAMDYGAEGYADTKSALEAQSLGWSDSGSAVYRTLSSGADIAIYSCVYSEASVGSALSWIAEAGQSADFVAVYITDTADQYEVSEEKRAAYRSFVDGGADLVVGTGGTKLQSAEQWGEGYIVYSLGSLLDGSSKYPEKYTALLDVRIKSDGGEIIGVEYELIPCLTYSEEKPWQPIIAEGEEYSNVMAFMNGESAVIE